jgi:cytochrome c oxidase cbb3-type subunit 4
MDINDFRVVLTVLTFIVFVAIVVWACSRKRKRDFDEAAMLPFSDGDLEERRAMDPKTGKQR